MTSDRLLFLGVQKLAWRGQQNNEHPPVLRALAYLEQSGRAGPNFNGALSVSCDELKQFILHLGWLARCNAMFPDLYITDQHQRIYGGLCNQGSLHLSFLDAEVEGALEGVIDPRHLLGEADECCNRFGRTSAIAGRMIDSERDHDDTRGLFLLWR